MTAKPVPHQPLLSIVPVSDKARDDLVARMTDATRRYHDMRHLDLLWERHLRHRVHASPVRGAFETLIAAAIAFHDAVYVAGAHDNEERSASLWLEVSTTATSLGPAERLWVADTIRATFDHLAAAGSIDLSHDAGYARQWVLDLDLTPLGEDPDVFDRNMDLLRAEAAQGSGPGADDLLIPALQRFASAEPLYRCRPIASAFAEKARRNFDRYLVG